MGFVIVLKIETEAEFKRLQDLFIDKKPIFANNEKSDF